VIPKAPFSCDLRPEEELRQFELLKPRLRTVWDALTAAEDQPYTSVVVPSLTLPQSELTKIQGIAFYEERLLFLLIRLRNPRAHLVYVTSQPVHPMILDYYFQFLSGVPANHARARTTLLCCHDASPRSLTEKILERPRLLQRIREGIPDKARAFLTVFNSTPLERKLSVLLGIPLNGLDPALAALGTKSGSRKIFREAGIPHPEGFEDLRDEGDVVRALGELKRLRPDLARAMVKLNESFSGEGNARFTFPRRPGAGPIKDALGKIQLAVPEETRETFAEKFRAMGGIVEALVEGREKRSPSGQMRIGPVGNVVPVSTHDQILGGLNGQAFVGCTFPADTGYRLRVQDLTARVGEALAAKGVVSRYSVDFVATRDGGGPWDLSALEINLRMGGTTHSYLALKFLTGGAYEASTGRFLSSSGRPLYYRATDNLQSKDYRGILPDDLIEILTVHRLHYSHQTESGVLFHLMGALSQFGKTGLTVIAGSRDQVEAIYARTLSILDAESAWGRGARSSSRDLVVPAPSPLSPSPTASSRRRPDPSPASSV